MNRIDSERSDLLESEFSRRLKSDSTLLTSSHERLRFLGLRRFRLRCCGAHEQNRTVDLILTKDVLCQLSYMGLRIFPRGAVEITSFPASSGTVYLKGSERCSSVPA